MTGTVAADFVFVPKVWSDHISAYFSKKLVFGAFATPDNTLTQQPGETVTFPYFKAIGAAEDAVEANDLTVDKLQDDSFAATVKEVGKAVSFTDKSIRKSAARRERLFDEAQTQIGRVHAEKVDADLITEINTVGNFTQGYTAADATGLCTVSSLFEARIMGFGDRTNEAAVIFMHSLNYLSMIQDSTAGFLKADANDPMYHVPGFMGRLFGAALVVVDTVPRGPDIATKQSYQCFICKPNAYGIMTAESMEVEKDRDILGRVSVVSATQWYAVKAFHAKIAAEDKRIVRATFVTKVAA
jgi:N4-gp56 family major capsid protein